MPLKGADCSRQAFIYTLTNFLSDKRFSARPSADGTALAYSFERKADADFVANAARSIRAEVEEYNYGGRSNLSIKGFTR